MMKKVVIVGAGPAGLMAAHFLSKSEAIQVQVFDVNKAVARKFLVAGHGGFNLSNSEEITSFIQKYNHPYIRNAVEQFTNNDTVTWLSEIGIETYIGSSRKIFPRTGIKPIEVLAKWLDYLEKNNVSVLTEHTLLDFDRKTASFQYKEEIVKVEYDTLIFSLGGASWKRTGSTGEWTTLLQSKNIEIIPFEASNAGIEIKDWKNSFGGGILKNVQVTIGTQTQFGEIELTDYGLEGAPIYAMSNQVRAGKKELILNLKPTMSREKLLEKFERFNGSKTDFLKEIKLSKATIILFKHFVSKDSFLNDDLFMNAIHQFILPIDSLRPIDEAISTVGGVAMSEINKDFQLKKYPEYYCIGEMLDWDAPTGGYLLQACFAMGFVVANSISSHENSVLID